MLAFSNSLTSRPGVKLHNEFVRPCLYCNRNELKHLQERYKSSEEEHWLYEMRVETVCLRCARKQQRKKSILASLAAVCCGEDVESTKEVIIPLPLSAVGVVERAVNAASTGKKGAEYRPHATFVHHLTLLGTSELHKQALCTWAPTAMRSFMDGTEDVTRDYSPGHPSKSPESPTLSPENANPDIEDGKMVGVCLEGNEYGEETRVLGKSAGVAEQNCATQIGPDLIPTEAFTSSLGNVKAGVSKRVRPPPYKGTRSQERKIYRLVSAIITNVFPREKIVKWREENPEFDEMKSKKWNSQRWQDAVNEALSDISCRIEQSVQVKKNEALPAKGKAPRPIINCGDIGQVITAFAVKCFEELLFEHFEDASIKHLPKNDAMRRVAQHLRQDGAHIIEGDGSAWDSCCSYSIRKQTENRIIKHIIDVLGQDAEVPTTWLKECMKDLNKPQLSMKLGVKDVVLEPMRVLIDSIRQSGHRGTSCFNWLINYVCWLTVICEHPERMVQKEYCKKTRRHVLPSEYVSALDGLVYILKYAFEGDDSAISTTENLKKHEETIQSEWKRLGFNMKLLYAERTFTFTGYNFLCDERGPTTTFMPEPARNIASSSWSTSSLLLSQPDKKHEVGAAAMLARALNYEECGPFAAYFSAIGLAHIKAGRVQDFGLDDVEAMRLGIQACTSVEEALHICATKAGPMTREQRKLMKSLIPTFSHDHEIRMLTADFGDNPCDTSLAKTLVPFEVWDPAEYERPRRRAC